MKLLASLFAVTLVSSFAFGADEKAAEEKPKRNPEEMLKRLDTDKDGSISLDEFKAGPMGKKDPAKAEEMFKKRDTNADGKLSLEELSAHGKKADK